MTETPESILTFWFGTSKDDATTAEEKSKLWWSKDEHADQEIRRRFESSTEAVARGDLDDWAATPHGVLAMVLLADQFPRNMYRGLPESFAFDTLALRWTLHALERGMDNTLRPIERVFLYLPLEHSESLADQQRSVFLFEQLLREVPEEQKKTFAGFVDFAQRHRDIIARFGRFPHRNAILERESTAEEQAFLKQPGSSF
ncbi:DUF924 family protein [uncultured Oxalicibacterium sp.]|uniref:DUF924 family protein n=1 Tax=uncultured Oxalicibacterium sp. TaxID=1168540 RepID=UPI0025D74C8C|nr:DUF924 family protein [uncultured Oxalicibacterium sp.]